MAAAAAARSSNASPDSHTRLRLAVHPPHRQARARDERVLRTPLVPHHVRGADADQRRGGETQRGTQQRVRGWRAARRRGDMEHPEGEGGARLGDMLRHAGERAELTHFVVIVPQ